MKINNICLLPQDFSENPKDNLDMLLLLEFITNSFAYNSIRNKLYLRKVHVALLRNKNFEVTYSAKNQGIITKQDKSFFT